MESFLLPNRRKILQNIPVKDFIEKLLLLQEKDLYAIEAKSEADGAPKNMADAEKKKTDAISEFENKKKLLAQLEGKREEMRTVRRALEEKAQHYKIQIATIKKQSDTTPQTRKLKNS